MADYRRRQRGEQIKSTTMPSAVVSDLLAAQDRIRELEGEVRRLKVELAQRSATPVLDLPQSGTAEQAMATERRTRATRQANIDAVLHRVNRA